MAVQHDIKDTDLPPELAEKLLLRLEICPKCQYRRTPADDALTPSYECPNCGVIYAVALEEIERRNRGLELQDMAEVHEAQMAAEAARPGVQSAQMGGAMFVSRTEKSTWGYVLLLCAALGLGVYAWW